MKIKLHIISFDIPWPANYGGAIDVFYKVKFLAEAGATIQLHCPVYAGRQPSEELESYCQKVWYYKRPANWTSLNLQYPYMVYSRRNKQLLENLLQDDWPIFFDGTNASYYLSHPLLKDRIKVFRPHNVEHEYFKLMAQRELHAFKRLYYGIESTLLRQYEKKLGAAKAFFPIAAHDYQYYREKFPQAYHEWIPAFHPFYEVKSACGTGDYAIYHGNLAHAENIEAALFLLENVIPGLPCNFVIAGRNPDAKIIRAAKGLANCTVIANPDPAHMDRLIHEAQIQVLPTFQNTGLKLKLLHALFNGRHVLVNPPMLDGTELDKVCMAAANAASFRKKIEEWMYIPFSIEEKKRRADHLAIHYDNGKNAQKIISFFQHLLL